MDSRMIITTLIVLIAACLTTANPVQRHDDATDAVTDATDAITDAATDDIQEIVIITREVDELIPSVDGVVQLPVIEREVERVIVEPVGEGVEVVKLEEEMMDTAAALVFRPYFRYRKPSKRRRINRNTPSRRTCNPCKKNYY